MKKEITKMRTILPLFGVLILFLFPEMSSAVTFDVVTSVSTIGVEQEVEVALFVDTEGVSINALSGRLVVGNGGVVTRISDGDSIIGAWVKPVTPDVSVVDFSGIIPRGINTPRGKVLTLYVSPKALGTVSMTFSGSTFANTPSGKPLEAEGKTADVVVVSTPQPIPTPQSDNTPPQILRAEVAQNTAMFDGKPFLVIEAKDADSGVGSLEILESADEYAILSLKNDQKLPWKRVKSPAPLSGSPETKFIYLRITDREGNISVALVSQKEQLSTEKKPFWLNKGLIFGILSIAAAFILWLWFSRQRKKII